jgi:hypothetical protein
MKDAEPAEALMSARPVCVPPHQWAGHWLTVAEFSRLMGRRPYTVYGWVRENVMSEFGISVYEFRSGRKHSARIFVRNLYI